MYTKPNCMAAPTNVDVSALIDRGKLGRYRIAIFTLLGLCLIMDGFDVQAMGYAAPAIIRDWRISNPSMGPVFGAGFFGLFLGSLIFSMVADRIGRRPVLLGATLCFSIFTLLTARANNVDELLRIRFLAGVGLGAILPNATALIGEYTPGRIRVATMMIVTNGFTLGAAIGGFLAAWLIPAYGWRSVFLFGGAVPLLIAVPMFVWAPESLQFLVLRSKPRHRIEKWLSRVSDQPLSAEVAYTASDERPREGLPVLHLFREGRARATTLLWTANFLNVLNAYFLASWLPTVVRDAGHPAATAVLAGTSVQVGGTIGGLCLGLVVQRIGFIPVLSACFALACLNLAVLGQSALPLLALFAAAFLAGLGIFGGQAALNALEATYYPTTLRSTGVGSGLAIGRIGAIIGPTLAGELMRQQWSTQDIFHGAAIPALVSALVMLSLRWSVAPGLGVRRAPV